MSSEHVLSHEPIELVVKARIEGKRLDSYLAARFPDYSRSIIQKVIDAGGVEVNGSAVKASSRIREGDVIRVRLPELPDDTPPPEDIPLSIIHEDDSLLVIDKPPGIVIHPAKGHWRGTLVNALAFHFENELSSVGGPLRPGIVHRLDRDTSGLVLVAKNDIAHARLAAQFEARTIQKTYLAIVHGTPDHDRDWINEPIGFHPTHREKMAIRRLDQSAKSAQTFYEVVELFSPRWDPERNEPSRLTNPADPHGASLARETSDRSPTRPQSSRTRSRRFALILCRPKTGRTHQIRVHLSHIGHPILADELYSGRAAVSIADILCVGAPDPNSVVISRQALHAHKLELTHPESGERLALTSPLPEDLTRLIEFLRGPDPDLIRSLDPKEPVDPTAAD
jgi:23S rRNA pseudouridine1911/1915/1917 synthase